MKLFSREIVRGVILAVLLLTGLVLGVTLYHSAGVHNAEAAPAAPPPAVEGARQATEPVSTETVAAPASPAALPSRASNGVPPPPPLAPKRTRSTATPPARAPVVRAAIHEEETTVVPPLPPEASPTQDEEKAPAAETAEGPPQPAESAAEPVKAKPENRGVRWIKSLGRHLRIGGAK